MEQPDDGRGAIAHWIDRVFGVGWTKKVVRICSYAKIGIIAIASGSIALNTTNLVHFPWLAGHWAGITSGALILREVISAYSANKVVSSNNGS